MTEFITLMISLGAGIFFKRWGLFGVGAHKSLNQFIINISLPALTLYYIPGIPMRWEWLYPIGVSWISLGGSFLFFSLLGKRLNWSKNLIGALVITAGFGNTSFLGFPIIEAIYGEEGLKTAILVDQPGNFLLLATLGILICSWFSQEKVSPKAMIYKVMSFPPFLAFLLAMLWNAVHFEMYEPLQFSLKALGSTVAPLALVSIGLQLSWKGNSEWLPYLSLGLLYRLIFAPALVSFFYLFVFGAEGLAIEVSLMEAAMAPMITAAIIASSMGLKPKLCTLMIGIGTPLSFVSLTAWYYLFQYFGV